MKLDPVVVHQLKIAAAYAKSTVKALVEDAIRIAGKTDRRFRFDEPRREQ